MSETNSIQFNKKKLQELCEKFGLSLVILFGSNAKKKGIKPESDVDIGIQVKDKDTIVKKDLALLSAFTEAFEHNKIDLTYLNYADPLLLYEIVKDGILIYQDKKGRFAEFKIKALKRHFDAKKFYELEDICLQRFTQRKQEKQG